MDYQDLKTSTQFITLGDETETSVEVGDSSPVLLEQVSSEDYNLAYACLIIPRFTNHYLEGDLADFLYKLMKRICVSFGWKLESIDIRPEYLQWVMIVPATTSSAHFMRIILQQTSKYIFEEFPRVQQENLSNHFWAAGYLVLAGMLPYPSEMIKQFIHVTRKQQGLQFD